MRSRHAQHHLTWTRVLHWLGSVLWQGALLVAGVLTASAISAGTNGYGRLILAVLAVFAIVVVGRVVLPTLGLVALRLPNLLITWWRWRRG